MWKELTADDVRGALSAPELMAYQTAAIGLGQDPLVDITATAVDEARGHIADCPRNQLAAGLTIPERVIHHVLAIIRFRLITRLDLLVSESRTLEYKDARRFFERVSECKVSIEAPDGGTPIDASSPSETMELVESAEREWTRRKQNGL